MISFILLAGGRGSRMHQETPKQFMLLAGKPIIMHTLERIDRVDQVDEIIIVSQTEYVDVLKEYITAYQLRKPAYFVRGGDSRQESAFNGLCKAKNDIVLIHEAARPFVKQSEFQQLIDEPATNATYGTGIPFTVLKGKKSISGILERDELFNVQLPQKFNRKELIKAHESAIKENKMFTEDASLLFYYSKNDIKILLGSSYNIKITEPIDLLMGDVIYKEYITGRD